MAITGATLTGLPETTRRTLSSNYIDFATAGGSDGWAQQYLPDLIEKEAEVFGNRTISGFLSQVGAEEAMAADQVVWSEQGRLHFSYKGYIANATQQAGNNNAAGGTIELEQTIDGHTVTDSATVVDHGVRAGDMVLVANASAVARCFVTAVEGKEISVAPYDATNNNGQLGSITGFSAGSDGDTDYRILVYGSEFRKGSNGREAANQPGFVSRTNKPIILKDKYEVSGSDASQIGWVEVSGEEGQSGYMWYLKAEGDTRARFADYLEMAMLESVNGDAAQSTADTFDATGGGNFLQATFGTEGLFSAIETRGNQSSGVTGVNAATDLAEFDAILAELDKNGAIEENMLFVNRATSLAIDDMLASMNSYGAGGTSYGVFDNSEDMALNLGFSGFRRGSYDFYKSDFKYLNDLSTRGAINDINTAAAIRGVMIPAGVSSVYDQNLGKNLRRPFLHVRFRASQTESRKMKSWVTGSVGAVTSDLDAMEVHYLSERCLVVQGANNFFLLN